MRRMTWSMLAVSLLIGLASCGAGKPPRLRTPAEIEADRRQLPTMYLTTKKLKKVIAPINALPFSDKESKEVCWPAYCCTNPNCPGKDQGTDGDPYVFNHVDPLVEVGPGNEITRVELPQGTDVYAEMRKRGGFAEPTCPECFKIRSRASVDATLKGNPTAYAERQKYRAWVKPYYPPETQKRMQELDAEQAKWDAFVLEHKNLPILIKDSDEKH